MTSSPDHTVHPAALDLCRKAVDDACKGLRRWIDLAPGMGKTRSMIEVIRSQDPNLRVLWFTPEVRPGSVGAEVCQAFKDAGVPVKLLLGHRPGTSSTGAAAPVTWEIDSEEAQDLSGSAAHGGNAAAGPCAEPACCDSSAGAPPERRAEARVIVLAHHFLPLIFCAAPSPRWKELLSKLTFIVVDENPVSALLTLGGLPTDKIEMTAPGGARHTTALALPLGEFLADLGAAGYLNSSIDLSALEAAVRQSLEQRSRSVRYISHAEVTTLLGAALAGGRRHELQRALRSRWWPQTLSGNADNLDPVAVTIWKAVLRRHATHVTHALAQLIAGPGRRPAYPHGLAVVWQDGRLYVRFAHLPHLHLNVKCAGDKATGRRSRPVGVVYLDAYPHKPVVARWLPRACRATSRHRGRPPEPVTIHVLRSPHTHDRLKAERSAVKVSDSLHRHVATLNRALEHVHQEKVLVMAHSRLVSQLVAYDHLVFRGKAQPLQFLYWQSGHGRNDLKGMDAVVLDDSRRPIRVRDLDYGVLSDDLAVRQEIFDRLLVQDFLQVIFRVRPYESGSGGARPKILMTYNPLEAYPKMEAFLKERLTVHVEDTAPIIGKSEHVLVRQALERLIRAALREWAVVPLQLLHIALNMPAPTWVETTPELERERKALHRLWETWRTESDYAALTDPKVPKPVDKELRAVKDVLRGLGLVARSQCPGKPVLTRGRGRPRPLYYVDPRMEDIQPRTLDW